MELALERLQLAGFRITRIRRAVLRYLERQREPKTAADIFRGIGQGEVDLASVYRTVMLLERLGLLEREVQGRQAAFALAGNPHHHHIVCRACERQACLPCDFSLPPPRGFTAVQHHLTLSGVCANCDRAELNL